MKAVTFQAIRIFTEREKLQMRLEVLNSRIDTLVGYIPNEDMHEYMEETTSIEELFEKRTVTLLKREFTKSRNLFEKTMVDNRIRLVQGYKK